MQSYLIISKNKHEEEEYLNNFLNEYRIDKFDISILNSEEKSSIGIGEIRNILKKIFLKPLKSDTKAVIIKDSQNLTIEAQNALLKVLEEPPQNTIIILVASNKNLLLPTIISRTKIIELLEKDDVLSKEEMEKTYGLLINLLEKGIGEKLKLAQDSSRSKQDSIEWSKKMIISLRHNLKQKYIGQTSLSEQTISNKQLFQILKSFQKTHIILSTTNANQRLALENLLLNL